MTKPAPCGLFKFQAPKRASALHLRGRYAMHDPDIQLPAAVVTAVGTAAVTIVLGAMRWLLGREADRIDNQFGEQDERIRELEKTIPALVKTTDLDRTESRILAAIGDAKHQISEAHGRIDRLQERR